MGATSRRPAQTPPPSEPDGRVPADVERALAAIDVAVRAALLDHKRAGNPVAVWRDGQVVWLQPEEIPELDPGTLQVSLAHEPGEFLVSRSQARVVIGRFVGGVRQVQVDFDGVDEIGQAFADELFRVFPLEHPDVRVVPVNAAPAVARMISRATAGAKGG